MGRVGMRARTEFMRRLDAERLFELLSFGYVLVVPIRKGVSFVASSGETITLPENHVCCLCMDLDGVAWLFDNMGIRTVTLEDVELWSGVGQQFDKNSLSWYYSRIILGARL
jgi:hypothetical protein